jgi:hypothetical protein
MRVEEGLRVRRREDVAGEDRWSKESTLSTVYKNKRWSTQNRRRNEHTNRARAA